MRFFLLSIFIAGIASCKDNRHGAILIQTDFGLKDGAVAAMKGVATEVDRGLAIYDLTHEIPAYNIWEAAYRLQQTLPYWPQGTVVVSVVDPGVGTARKSVVARTNDGKFIVSPDNGTLTLIDNIESVREIDETINRRAGSETSHTFHGRDVYIYTAARLASGKISFEEVGRLLTDSPVKIPFQSAAVNGDSINGNIPILDIQYGNVWTNIPDTMILATGFKVGDSLTASIYNNDSLVLNTIIPLVNSFGDVPEGRSLAYFNSVGNLSFAINMGSFSNQYSVHSGPGWRVSVRRTGSRNPTGY